MDNQDKTNVFVLIENTYDTDAAVEIPSVIGVYTSHKAAEEAIGPNMEEWLRLNKDSYSELHEDKDTGELIFVDNYGDEITALSYKIETYPLLP